MALPIEYYDQGRQIRKTPYAGLLPDVERVARDGLVRHSADFYRIIDVDGSNAEVASGRRDVHGT